MKQTIRPHVVQLEASSHCQLRCPVCPTTLRQIDAPIGRGFLNPDTFARFLDANPDIRHVELSNNGEIFLNPGLLAILRLAEARGVTLGAANGANLNDVRPSVLEGVVRHRLRFLTCSIDGATAETYRVYRVRGDFDRVMANVRTIAAHKRRLGSPFPVLRWQFVVFSHNVHELPAARALAEEIGMQFTPKLNWDADYAPVPGMTRAEHRAQTGRDYAGLICHQLWDSPQVNFDGGMLGCCRNTWGRFGTANAFTDGFATAVNSEPMAHARAMLRGAAAPREGIPCTTCDLYRDMRASGRFLRRREDDAGAAG